MKQAESGERPRSVVEEEQLLAVFLSTAVAKHIAQEAHGLRPEGTNPLLAPLSQEPHLLGRAEAHVSDAHLHDLLRAGTGVVEKPQQSGVTPASRACSIRAGEQVLDVCSIEAGDWCVRMPLEWNAEDLSTKRGTGGLLAGDEAKETVDGGQPDIPRSYAVLALHLEVIEEVEYDVPTKVLEVELDDIPFGFRSCEPEKKNDRVAIGANRVHAQIAASDKVKAEEVLKSAR
jgi:hypothetical protein